MNSETIVARSNFYNLLSIAFGYPGDELKEGLMDNSFTSQLMKNSKKIDGYNLKSYIKSLQSITQKYGKNVYPKVSSEYRSLFSPEHKGTCSPYEAGYLKGPLFMNTGELADIAGFYNAFGVQVSEGNKDRVDHISLELEFMYFLTLKEAFALQNQNTEHVELCKDAQRKFLIDHLGRWTGVFHEVIEKKGDSKFFLNLSQLVDKFVANDSNKLGIRPERIKLDQLLENTVDEEDVSCAAVNFK